ncbi:MAG: hypothetical protein MUD04_13270 [Cyanobium sp. Prado107]|jgi:hypothetical protein|nr:hypothetical protein [Cyanobium sp. Prado107]
MPTNVQMKRCIAHERGALVFWSPDAAQRRPGARMQVLDVFSLQVATGYTRDPQGRLLLEAQPSLAAGRSWSLARAAQLIRNDVRPHRWVALQQDRRAWGLFWAGGGLQHCRELLEAQASGTEPPSAQESSALAPVTPEALLRVLLDLEADQPGAGRASRSTRSWRPGLTSNPWKVVAWTSLAWMVVLGITAAGFMAVLERQDRQLELLLERTAPTTQAP